MLGLKIALIVMAVCFIGAMIAVIILANRKPEAKLELDLYKIELERLGKLIESLRFNLNQHGIRLELMDETLARVDRHVSDQYYDGLEAEVQELLRRRENLSKK